jgi:tetratricopeptide (TPR) repeat protein
MNRFNEFLAAINQLRSIAVQASVVLMLLASVGQAEDSIDSELALQRAVSESLQGNSGQAVASLTGSKDTASLYTLAMFCLEAGDVEAGVEALEAIAGRDDAPAETQKYLSVGYLHLNRAKESELAAEKYLAAHQDDTYSHYIRGLAKYYQRQPDEARIALRQAGYDDEGIDSIQQVAMQAPVDINQRRSTIASSQETLRQQNQSMRAMKGDADRPYNFTFLTAGEYDTNVPLLTNFSGLGSGSQKEDYRFLMAAFLDFQLISKESFNVGLVGSTYNTFQFDLDQFNVQDYMGGAYTNTLLSDRLIGSLRYEFHETLVDNDHFSSEHRLTPSLSRLASWGHTTAFYEFNPVQSDAPFLIPEQNQTAVINRIGFTQAIYTFGGEGRIYGGYQYNDADAEGSDFDRHSNVVTGRIERPITMGLIADLDIRFFWDDYDNGNSLDFFGQPRRDERLELRLGVQKNFVRPVSLRFDYTYFDNASNTENLFGVRFYDYERHVVSTQLIFSI